MTPEIDIAFDEHDSLVRLKPLTDKARRWFNRYVAVEDPALTVDGWIPTNKAPASMLLQDASNDGLHIAPIPWYFLKYAWDTSMPNPVFLTLSGGDS